MKGSICTTILYGGKNSGKTYTIIGPDDDDDNNDDVDGNHSNNNNNNNNASTNQLPLQVGLLPRCLNRLYHIINKDKLNSMEIHISCLHVYKEHMHDLFALDHADLTIQQDANVIKDRSSPQTSNHIVSGLSKVQTTNAKEAIKLFNSSIHNRSYIEHQLEMAYNNIGIGRQSHVVYILEMYNINQHAKVNIRKHHSYASSSGKMVFVDVGSNIDGNTNIALGKVLRELTTRHYYNTSNNKDKKNNNNNKHHNNIKGQNKTATNNTHISYRDSFLTRL